MSRSVLRSIILRSRSKKMYQLCNEIVLPRRYSNQPNNSKYDPKVSNTLKELIIQLREENKEMHKETRSNCLALHESFADLDKTFADLSEKLSELTDNINGALTIYKYGSFVAAAVIGYTIREIFESV